ncbi:MAG: hypothetical protein ACJ75J_00445 [Cytophagaceae bacterium]
MIKIHLLLLSLILTLQGCIVPQFSEPQPQGIKEQSVFPAKLRGRYQVRLLNVSPQPDNQSTVLIDSTSLNLYEVKKIKVALSDIKADSSIRLTDELIYLQEKTGTVVYPYALKNDTAYYTDSNTVKLNLGVNCVFKEWKGHYFINNKREKYWDALLMDEQKENVYSLQALVLNERLDNDTPAFSDPSEIPIDSFYYKKKAPAPVQENPKKGNKEELYLDDLEKLMSVKKEGLDYIIKPSRRQLKKMIRKKFFKEVWRIERVN